MIKKLIGLFIVVVGLLLLFANLNLLDFHIAMKYLWPSLIILIGMVGMIEKKKFDITFSIILILGINFLLNNLKIVNDNLITIIFWPLILVLFGSSLLFRKDSSLKKPNNQKYYTAVFGEISERNNDDNFIQSDITTIFGGGKIDFSEIKLKQNKAYINVVSIFGGMELILPEDYAIVAHGLPIFGSCENKVTTNNKDSKKQLIINYTVIFGGIDLKN
jgi:predicted membrane protein